KSQSTSQSQSNSAQGSTIQAGCDVNLVSSTPAVPPEPVQGGGSSQGNILVRGSEVRAGDTVRVYVQEENKSSLAGSWMMRSDDIKGLTPEQIASKYALPQVPTHIADVAVPAGQTMRVSVANDV